MSLKFYSLILISIMNDYIRLKMMARLWAILSQFCLIIFMQEGVTPGRNNTYKQIRGCKVV